MSAISNNTITDVNAPAEQTRQERANTNNSVIDEKNAQENINKINEVKATVEKAEKEDVNNISSKQLEVVAQQLQEFVGGMNKGLEFLVDKDSGRDVIKVIDKNNGDLIKQYPSEEVLNLVSKLSDATGALVNEKI